MPLTKENLDLIAQLKTLNSEINEDNYKSKINVENSGKILHDINIITEFHKKKKVPIDFSNLEKFIHRLTANRSRSGSRSGKHTKSSSGTRHGGKRRRGFSSRRKFSIRKTRKTWWNLFAM
jgi:hypothetical protein